MWKYLNGYRLGRREARGPTNEQGVSVLPLQVSVHQPHNGHCSPDTTSTTALLRSVS